MSGAILHHYYMLPRNRHANRSLVRKKQAAEDEKLNEAVGYDTDYESYMQRYKRLVGPDGCTADGCHVGPMQNRPSFLRNSKLYHDLASIHQSQTDRAIKGLSSDPNTPFPSAPGKMTELEKSLLY